MESAKLPQKGVWVTMLSMDNRVLFSGNLHYINIMCFFKFYISHFLSGGSSGSSTFHDIMELNTTTTEWKKIGELSSPRDQHQMASVDVTEFGCSL